MLLSSYRCTNSLFPRRNANATIQCPVEKGTHKVVQIVTLPKEIPPGTFVLYSLQEQKLTLISAQFKVEIRGYTADDDDLLCLDLSIDFRYRPGSFVPW